jgi:hypothetical protein
MRSRAWIWFWICRVGTVIFTAAAAAIIVAPYFWFELFMGLLLITLPYPFGLCVASSNLIRSHPHLARRGMYTFAWMVAVFAAVICYAQLKR